jgi:acetolactate synthase small subunit
MEIDELDARLDNLEANYQTLREETIGHEMEVLLIDTSRDVDRREFDAVTAKFDVLIAGLSKRLAEVEDSGDRDRALALLADLREILGTWGARRTEGV